MSEQVLCDGRGGFINRPHPIHSGVLWLQENLVRCLVFEYTRQLQKRARAIRPTRLRMAVFYYFMKNGELHSK